ncbi:hypothetical protein PL75_09985 [Neisseria arctica]|uniref:Uncharacterized protein n=1 Tax=Neisseria arctica TaxID=1470200 RepID=A0A0J0YPQ7_9NEIS|nr:hypothetical protein [Neisseria arctica]KLT72117.1 hypothetical protein PL75_09985 [Neisseria arctica]UOO85904.1 hypothetical protein LVJ86_06600 [Neisseria arctica]
MDTRKNSELVFTLEEPVRRNEPVQEDFDWEKGLEKLRERRSSERVPSVADNPVRIARPAVSSEPVWVEAQRAIPPTARASHQEIDARIKQQALQEYLRQWQQEHNDALPKDQAETDATVLLQEDWLAAQSSLQVAADDSQISEQRTVWLKPKRKQSTEYAVDTVDQETNDQQDEDIDLPAQSGMPVTVQVLAPQIAPNQRVMCLSEQELFERLVKRLRPHLTDAVSGMVRVAVQKQTAAITYQLQQMLNEQTPGVVDEVLEYNLKAVMSEIKYDLKFKR